MSLSRRAFLNDSAAFGLLSSLLSSPELTQAATTQTQSIRKQPTVGEEYWKSLYSTTRSNVKVPDTEREPRFLHFSDATGLRWVEDIKVDELPSFDEEAVISIELSALRTGSQDHSKLSKVQFSQLHLSCQRVAGSEFLGPIVWAVLATAFTDKASKIPNAQSLSWSALTAGSTARQSTSQTSVATINHIPLNHGAGHLTIAVTNTPPESTLHRVLGTIITATGIMAPLLGFPGIAVPALESFYTFYGQLEQARKENFLLNSAQKDIVVTQQGATKTAGTLVSANALRLLSGELIAIPKSQEKDFEQSLEKLEVQNGFLVERDSKDAPDVRVANAIPTVSYVTLSVKVLPASSFPSASTVTDPLLESPPQPSDASSESTSKTKSKGKTK